MHKMQRHETNDRLPNKRIMCHNVLNKRRCKYGSGCVYAHSSEEQKVDKVRQQAYRYIREKLDMSDVDLDTDQELLSTFITLTKLCYRCSKNMCPGRDNCRDGAVCQEQRVCYDDLMTRCYREDCNKIHLSKQNLKFSNKRDTRSFTKFSRSWRQTGVKTDNPSYSIKRKTNTVWDSLPLSITTKSDSFDSFNAIENMMQSFSLNRHCTDDDNFSDMSEDRFMTDLADLSDTDPLDELIFKCI